MRSETGAKPAVELKLGADPSLVGPSLDFIESYAAGRGAELGAIRGLRSDLSRILERVMEKNSGEIRPAALTVRMTPGARSLSLELLSRGCPVFSQDLAPGGPGYRNLGRLGQSLELAVPAAPGLEKRDAGPDAAADSSRALPIRELRAGEEPALSELFYRVYGYRYLNDAIYFPEKIRAMIEDGRLRAFVAEDAEGKLAGHVGLVRLNADPPVYETALGAVDPRFKSGGLFSRILERVMRLMQETPMQYSVYDFVTNHVFSQKRVAKYGYCDLALFLGNQVADTQAKLSELGLGEDPEDMDRYSVLLGVGPRAPDAFGKEVLLPINIGEALGFLLKPLGLAWAPTPRFHPLPAGGDYARVAQEEQKALIFDFHAPGRQALDRIVEECERGLREGYQYFAVDVPLDWPGIGQLSDILARGGFFMAGFIPYRYGRRLGFRFQFLTPIKVCFDGIRLHSEAAKRLLQVVRRSYERNSLL